MIDVSSAGLPSYRSKTEQPVRFDEQNINRIRLNVLTSGVALIPDFREQMDFILVRSFLSPRKPFLSSSVTFRVVSGADLKIYREIFVSVDELNLKNRI